MCFIGGGGNEDNLSGNNFYGKNLLIYYLSTLSCKEEIVCKSYK